MSSPTLSICIPTYNRSKWLHHLLESLVQQVQASGLGQEVEIVVSDNSSTDNTQEIGRKWAALYPFVRYFRTAYNIGGDPNQVRAVELASGTFAWLFGDDDKVRPGAVRQVFGRLRPGLSQLFLNYRCMTQEGVCMSPSRMRSDIPDGITTIELVKRLGFITAYSLITSHVFDRARFLAADPQALLKISPWYAITTIMIMAFHHDPVELVREPVIDFTMDNDRLPDELVHYVRVIGLLKTLRTFEAAGAADSDFFYGCYESGAGDRWNLGHSHYFREEIYRSLTEFIHYWALPGRDDYQLIREFVDSGPGFWDVRMRLKEFFVDDYKAYAQNQKPVIHYWHGKAWFPAFSLLLSSDDRAECKAFDQLVGTWPEEFVHESILVSRLSEDSVQFENLDVFMAPYRPHASPSASLNSGFRKTLTPRVLAFHDVKSSAVPALIRQIDDWQSQPGAPDCCLIFESAPTGEEKVPAQLLGFYFKRHDLVFRGGFENLFNGWSRQRLLADAAYRLGAQGWALEGGAIPPPVMARWYAAQIPAWVRLWRKVWKGPFSEHGLNITLRGHFERLRREGKL